MPGKVVSRSEWLEARLDLLAKEKEHTRNNDKLSALRADMPVVKVTSTYAFTDANNKPLTLSDLFENRPQLIVYHFMYDPAWEKGCIGCSFLADNIPPTFAHLNACDTTFVFVSRAPIEKITAFQTRMNWTHIKWVSSFGSEFNYDFHSTQDESQREVLYNYMDKKTLESRGLNVFVKGEQPGFSVFWKCEESGDVFHSYSTYSRGADHFPMTTALLDITPLGRQDKNEKTGKAGKELKYRDLYTAEDLAGEGGKKEAEVNSE